MKNVQKSAYFFEGSVVNFNNWGFFLVLGVSLVILGLLAMSFSVFTTLISVFLLGFLLLFSGVLVVLDSVQFWKKKGGHFWMQFFMGLLYGGAGLALISSPIMGSVSITLLLGVLFVTVGIFRMIYSVSSKLPRWGWIFFSGIITLLLGALILAGWPGTGLFVIGLFLGIDLLFLGIQYIMLALFARKV